MRRFEDILDYSAFMAPKTERVYQFKSRRVDFCRRPLFKDKMLIILEFEGVFGDLKKKDLSDDKI